MAKWVNISSSVIDRLLVATILTFFDVLTCGFAMEYDGSSNLFNVYQNVIAQCTFYDLVTTLKVCTAVTLHRNTTTQCISYDMSRPRSKHERKHHRMILRDITYSTTTTMVESCSDADVIQNLLFFKWTRNIWCALTASLHVTVSPSDVDVHTSLGHTPYSMLDVSYAGQLPNCTSLHGPVPVDTEIESFCDPGASGRYIYVYLNTTVVSSLYVFEVWVYDDPVGEART